MKTLTYGQILEARSRFREQAMLVPPQKRFVPYFDFYTGFTFPDMGWWHQAMPVELKDEEARRVELMLSDNYKTIFKAWVAKHGNADAT